MNKQDILNLTGLSEQEFYSQYPDQASFCNAYPDACNQMNTTMQMGGQQNQQQQLMQEISSMIKQGVDPKKILQQLVKIGMDTETAMQMIQAVAQQQSGQPSSETQQQEQMMYEDDNAMMDDSDMMEYGGIHIDPKNKGKFTESANRAGMGVQKFASHVLANKEDYSSTQVKRANFARNAAKWKHEDGGNVYQNGGYYGYDGKYHKSKGSGTYNAGTYFAVGGEEQLASNIIAPAFNPFGFYDPNTNVDANLEVSPFTASPPSNLTAPQNNAIMINKNFTANDKVDSPIAPQVASTKPKKNRFGKTMGNIATGLDLGINLAGIASNIYDQTKQKKDFDKYMQSKMSTMGQYGALANTVNSSKGDYSVTGSTYGQFRPDQMGQFSNAGMYNGVYYPGMAMYGAEMMQVGGLAGASSEKYINRGTIPTPSQMMDMPMMAPVDNVGRAPYQTFNQENKPDTANLSFNDYVPNPLPNPKGKDVATKLNNPGNMLYTPVFKKLFGATDSGIKQTDGNGRFAAFPSLEIGLKAREVQMFGAVDNVPGWSTRIYKPNMTVNTALSKWSNNGYDGSIYPEIANKPLYMVTPAERKELMKRQIQRESGSMYKTLKNKGIFQYGGSMKKNEQFGGQVLEMDENEIKQFLAAGGQLEFLD